MSSTGHPMPSSVGPFVHAEVCRSEERLTESAAASSLTFRHRGRACAWDRGVRGESKRTGGYTRLYNQTGSAVGKGRSKVEPINGSAARVVIVRGCVMVRSSHGNAGGRRHVTRAHTEATYKAIFTKPRRQPAKPVALSRFMLMTRRFRNAELEEGAAIPKTVFRADGRAEDVGAAPRSPQHRGSALAADARAA